MLDLWIGDFEFARPPDLPGPPGLQPKLKQKGKHAPNPRPNSPAGILATGTSMSSSFPPDNAKCSEVWRIIAQQFSVTHFAAPRTVMRARRKGYEVSVMKAVMNVIGLAAGPVRLPA